MENLSLVPEEDLLNELCKRYDHVAIMGLKINNKQGDFVQLRRWDGNKHIIISQLEIFKVMLIHQELSTHMKIGNNNLDL